MTEPRNVYGDNGDPIGCFFFGPTRNGSVKFQTRSRLAADQPVHITFILSKSATHLKDTLSLIFLEADWVVLGIWEELCSETEDPRPLNRTILSVTRGRAQRPQQIVDQLWVLTQKKLQKITQATAV